MVAPTAINTGYFFHQRLLAETQAWPLELLALSVAAYAAAGIISTVTTGMLVDRFGATRLARVHLLPLAIASLMLLGSSRAVEAPIFFALMGLTATAHGVIVPAVLAELFGTEHLGAIRALAVAIMVAGSALTPGLFGVFFDAQVSLASIGVGSAFYVLCACAANLPLARKSGRSPTQLSASAETAHSKSATASSTALNRTALRPRSP
jgi:MFS family permease